MSCTSFPFLAAAFFYCVNDFLVSFFELGYFNFGVLCVLLVFNIPNRLMFFVYPPGMGVLPGRVDQESSHNISMVTTHVDHVVGLSVLHISQVSSLGQNVVNFVFLFLWRNEGRLFMRRLPEHRVERGVVVSHQPAFQPVTSLVTFVESVPANTFTFRSFTRSQLSIEVSSNDRNVFFIIQHVFLNCFVHLLDVVTACFECGKYTLINMMC